MQAPGRTPRRTRGTAAAVAAWLLAGPAHGQLGATVAVDSDYRSRGVSLSDSNPSPRLTLNYEGAERWYAGASATRAALTEQDTYPQLIGYAGWVASAVDGRSIEIGVVGSTFAGSSGYDFLEAYLGLLASDWSARLYYSPNYYGRGVATAYVEFNAHVPIDERARVFAHVGVLAPLQSVAGDAGRTRGDVSVGAGYVVRGWDLHVAAVAVSRGGPYPAVYNGRHATVVVGVSFSF